MSITTFPECAALSKKPVAFGGGLKPEPANTTVDPGRSRPVTIAFHAVVAAIGSVAACAKVSRPGVARSWSGSPKSLPLRRAVRLKRSLGDLTGLTQFGFHLITVQPGHESTEYHRHLYAEEYVYILSGTSEAIIDDESREVGPGDFMGFARGGAAHTLLNTGHAPLVLIVAGQRLEQDVCDYPHKGKRMYAAGTNKIFVDLAKESEA